LEFDPSITANQKYPITEYQPTYFVADSFATAKDRLKQFAATMDRPFSVRYNPYTQSVEIVDNRHQLTTMIKEVQSQLSTLAAAIQKLPGIKD
jgi:phenylalanine-4-hydroxylase